ncbi:MAG: DbpA RNA binding domain-containing protein [Spirochaetia bacterium]|uniref:DbpA RNA binding domain-containing protein n=1 Tax=Treponema berlinense TaxID=225004 RepID=UPI0026F13233|nr:DbpA RNA binding domain-containing protein [Treponema berlinense]MDD5790491.1 DbpA RNA binding domain-containing protein [Spirochaetia bacterium]
MAYIRRETELNMDQVAAFLKNAVSRVESNPEYYEELKKVFKKTVPLTRRSYVAAYLLQCSKGAIFRFNPNRTRENYRSLRDDNRRSRYEDRKDRFEGSDTEPRERSPRIEIDPENASTVFVSIGRNRHVFARDLLGLFINEAGIERERIGNIKVLANYSFVELFKEDADKAIAALNDFDWRGRKLSVSHSEKKDPADFDERDAGAPEDYINTERVPDVENRSAPIVDSFTATNSDTVAQQAAFAKAMEKSPVDMTDEEIMALRRPRSSSSADL